jgi:hypothetical protein
MRKHNQSTKDNMCFNIVTHLHKKVCKKKQVIENIKNHNVKRIQDLIVRQPKNKVSARDTKMQRKFKQSQNDLDNEIKLLAMLNEEKNSQSFEKKV